jgi:flagellar hook-basal body complex protein FliE
MKLTDVMLNQLSNTTNSANKISQKSGNDKISFKDELNNAVDKVAKEQQNADLNIQDLLTSDSNRNIHEVMLSLQKAEISLKLMTKVRDKGIDAYREMMRMNV